MKNILKKMAIVVSSMLLVGGLLTGCGNKSEKDKEEHKSQGSSKPVVKVATSGKYYPYTFMEDDKLVGFDIDVWAEIGKRINKDIKWELTGFDGMFGMLDTGKVDSAAHQITVTEARKKKYTFSEVYAYNPYKICVAESTNDISKLEDLFGKKLACQATESKKELIDNFDKNNKIEKVIYGDNADYLREIELGRVDATLHAVANFDTLKEKGNYKLKLVGENVFYENNAYPFSKKDGNEELIKEVNKAIEDMHKDGTLSGISKKWLKQDITVK